MSTQFNTSLQDDYIYPRVINWQKVILDIVNHGESYSDICRVLGVPWSTLQGWREGAEPRHSMGSGLLLVHAKYCGPELTNERVMEAELY
jgi:hypothetical protein